MKSFCQAMYTYSVYISFNERAATFRLAHLRHHKLPCSNLCFERSAYPTSSLSLSSGVCPPAGAVRQPILVCQRVGSRYTRRVCVAGGLQPRVRLADSGKVRKPRALPYILLRTIELNFRTKFPFFFLRPTACEGPKLTSTEPCGTIPLNRSLLGMLRGIGWYYFVFVFVELMAMQIHTTSPGT